jgi:hypothetical protein
MRTTPTERLRASTSFAGSTLVGSATASPFAFTWADVGAGDYVLTARDRQQRREHDVCTSIGDGCGPRPNRPPQVSVTSPANGGGFTVSASITIAADASDPDDGVARVEFFADSTSIGVATSAPYRAEWSNVPAGQYSLTAVATDASGTAATSNAVPFKVSAASSIDEIVVHAAPQPEITGGWTITTDTTAACGVRLQNPDVGAPTARDIARVPERGFELTFNAEAGKLYRLGGSAARRSMTVTTTTRFTRSSTTVWTRRGRRSGGSIRRQPRASCSRTAARAGLNGWGWADTGYGVNAFGPEVYFATSGPRRVRIQVREDGLAIDQIVLSAAKYVTGSPGATKNDATMLSRTP